MRAPVSHGDLAAKSHHAPYLSTFPILVDRIAFTFAIRDKGVVACLDHGRESRFVCDPLNRRGEVVSALAICTP